LHEGETLGVVGESGCGKTTLCQSIVGLLPTAARIVGGRIEFAGQDLAMLSQRQMRHIRGQIAMILQDPMASLNPLFSIYRQVAEPAYYHLAVRPSRSASGCASCSTPCASLAGDADARVPAPDVGRHAPAHRGAIALAGGPCWSSPTSRPPIST
jgi:ABC-type dipeptide/oligopeptide/nickel transport system ATPase component